MEEEGTVRIWPLDDSEADHGGPSTPDDLDIDRLTRRGLRDCKEKLLHPCGGASVETQHHIPDTNPRLVRRASALKTPDENPGVGGDLEVEGGGEFPRSAAESLRRCIL